MLQLESNETHPPHDTVDELSAQIDQWPRDAMSAYHQLVRELNRWCREHDYPTGHNHWVAEEAVRQSWSEAA